MINNALKELKLNGKQLDKNDEEKIIESLNKLVKLESQLIKLYKYLELFNYLVKFTKTHNKIDNEPDNVNIRYLKEKYDNSEDTNDYLKNTLSNLEISLDKNWKEQGTLCNDLFNITYQKLISMLNN